MEIAALIAAFAFGFVAARVGLPPLVGYLVAGYVLSTFGFESTELVETIADLGVLLLLFGIGLKLRLRTFAQPYVWGTATVFAIFGALLPAAALLIARAVGLVGADVLGLREALIIVRHQGSGAHQRRRVHWRSHRRRDPDPSGPGRGEFPCFHI